MRPIHDLRLILSFACLILAWPASAQDAPVGQAAIAPPISQSSLDHAQKMLWTGKLDAAEEEFTALSKSADPAPAYVGLARVELKRRHPEEAFAFAAKAVELAAHSADAQVAMGEVYFRQGRIPDAEKIFVDVINSGANNARAYFGLARVSNSASLYRRGKEMIDRAYSLDPANPDIRGYWLARLSVEDRTKALQDILANYPDGDDAGRAALNRQLTALFQTPPSGAHQCRMVSKVTATQTNLRQLLIDSNHLRGYGLDVKLNGTSSHLMLDTGAGSIIIDRKVAEKAGIKQIVQTSIGGIGDQGPISGYVGTADSIQIGDLEFDDCNVRVVDRNSVAGEDGLVGGDVFAHYLVDIDMPNEKFRLSELPPRPDEPPVPASLEADPNAVSRFHDRYIAPEMQSYVRVFRFGHLLLIPTRLNDSISKLFVIDTGALTSMISPEAAREVTKVSGDDQTKVKGLSGNVKDVFRGDELTLTFGNLRQKIQDMIAFDMKPQSDSIGTEVSGTLGFTALRMLDMRIDYRDGLVSFTFDPNRWRRFQ